MKKFITGMICGIVLSASTAYAKDTIKSVQAFVSSTTLTINGAYKEMDNGYEVLRYKDHLYVPARFLAENTSMTVQYDAKKNSVSIYEAPFYPNAKFADIVKGKVEKIVFDAYGGPEVITDKKRVADYVKGWEEITYTRVPKPDYANMKREDVRLLVGTTKAHLYDQNNTEIANLLLQEEDLVCINNNYYRMSKSAFD